MPPPAAPSTTSMTSGSTTCSPPRGLRRCGAAPHCGWTAGRTTGSRAPAAGCWPTSPEPRAASTRASMTRAPGAASYRPRSSGSVPPGSLHGVSTSSAGPPKAAVDRLRDIETVTHAGLAHLGVEELLVELLDRVRNVLDADTAAVLLLDGPNEQLVATAARGIEEEVYQGARVPLGRGFAGRIATTRAPAAIVDVADADVVNPVLRENGVRSLLGVPLLAGGELLGVLHVGSIALRRFDDMDADLLQMVADRIALAVTAAQSDTERKASALL